MDTKGMWRKITLLLVSCLLLIPLASAETERQFLTDVADIMLDGSVILGDVTDALNDFADGWITESEFYVLMLVYRTQMKAVEDRIFAKNAPCSAYDSYLWNAQQGTRHARYAMDDIIRWSETGNEDYLDKAFDHFTYGTDYLTTASNIMPDYPACETGNGGGNGGTTPPDEETDYWSILGGICIFLSLIAVAILVLWWYQTQKKKEAEEKLRREGMCEFCKGSGKLWSSEEGMKICNVCDGTGRKPEPEMYMGERR